MRIFLFFDFLSRFVRDRLQSWQKVLVWPQKYFFITFWKGCRKTQNLMLILNLLKKCKKASTRKDIGIKVYKLCTFSTFSRYSTVPTVSKSSHPCNILRVHFFAIFSTDSKSASISAFFDTHITNIWKKYFLGHISTSCKLLSQTRTKRRNKTKNVFYKCVLEFISSSIYGSGLLIFSKKV